MVDQGKGAGLPVRPPHGSTASDGHAKSADPNADQPAPQPAPRGGLSELTRNRLASQLRTMYDTMTQQPVPDRFAELIAKLDSGDHDKSR